MQTYPSSPLKAFKHALKGFSSTDAELYGEKAMEAVRGNRSWEPRSAATLVYSRNFWPGLYPFTSNSQEEGLLPRHGLISLRLNLFQE
ncbi:hypothetical protein ES319_A03G071400v1 [Gossypium barbadense]|uniref:Uncharacterized protein n=1 Tax=Gossypium barbadense TaxID=3634 RepID=A0A5J5WDT8_GOSBA|nr:hypothetical protein ES319_A03G071400v1 [Gossypium barbadense]